MEITGTSLTLEFSDQGQGQLYFETLYCFLLGKCHNLAIGIAEFTKGFSTRTSIINIFLVNSSKNNHYLQITQHTTDLCLPMIRTVKL